MLGVTLAQTPRAKAANLYWDANGTSPGTGGSGTWDTVGANWSTTAAGLDAAVVGAFGADDTAIFASSGGTVTLGGPVTIGGLVFTGADFTVSGDTLTLAASSGAPTISVTNGNFATVASVLSGAAGLTKQGGGVLRLAHSANTYEGVTTIANGALVISSGMALGSDSSAVSIFTTNQTPLSGAMLGFGGGALVLDGMSGGFTFARDINFEGRGPIGDRSSAILSMGNNTLSGVLTAASSPLPLSPGATFRNSRINSVNGTLILSGSLISQGTTGSTFVTLGGNNAAGTANINLTGVLSGTGSLEKAGAGALLLNPSSTAGFSGTLRIAGGASGQQSSVRVIQATSGGVSVFGANTGTGGSSVIDLNGGVLEFRSDGNLDFNALAGGKNVYHRANSTVYAGPALGGSGVNGLVTLGAFRIAANTTATFVGRNGYGVTLQAWTQESSNNPNAVTNNLGGTLTFAGDAWNNNDGSTRTLTIAGGSNTTIQGSILASGTTKVLTKNDGGTLVINGTASTLTGAVNVTNGEVAIRDFRAVNNNTVAVNLGSGTNTVALIIGTDQAASAAGLVTAKPVDLAGTTGSVSIYANQAGANPVVLNGAITATGAGAKTLSLGGSSVADNRISSAIVNNSATNTTALTKLGAGTWVLAGANTYTGTTTLSEGTLKLLANAATSTILPSGNAVAFGATNIYAGATLEFVGQAGVSNLQNLGTLTYPQGANTIKVTPGVGGSASLTFANITTNGAASVNIVGADFTTNKVAFTQRNGTAATNGLVTRSVYWNGADFAYSEGAVLRAPNYGVDANTATTVSGPLTAGNEQRVQGTATLSANTSISTLKLDGDGRSVGGAFTLTLSGGGLLSTGGANSVTTTTLALGTGALVARVNDGSLSISSTITGSGGLTKSGPGVLMLSGANAQTGIVTINEGTIRLVGSGRLGAAADLTLRQGAVLDLNGITPANAVNALNSNGLITNGGASAVTLTVGGSNGSGTSYGAFQDGTGVLNVTKTGSGAQSWLGLSSHTGVTTIGGSALVTVQSLADLGMPSGVGRGDVASNAASLVFGGTSAAGLVYQGNVLDGALTVGTISAATNRLFTLAGTAAGSGATLSSSAANNNAVVWTNFGDIAFGAGAAAQTLILRGASTGDNTFNPRLSDNGAVVSSLTKTDAGQWNLGNPGNAYTGVTSVNNGILALNDPGALPLNSPVVLGATTTSGTLQASGVLARDLATSAVAGNGTITWGGTTGGGGFAAHASPLTVTLNAGAGLTWGSGGFVGTGGTQTLFFGSASALSDVTFTNAIDLGSAQRTINVVDNGSTGADYATLTGVLSGAGGLRKEGGAPLRLLGLNLYGGVTDIQSSSLVVYSLGSSTTGGGSSVGQTGVAMGNANAVTIGNASTSNAILQYVGPGEISDRKIRINATTGDSAGAQIHADGTGPLILTNVSNDMVNNAAHKNLWLRGSSPFVNQITSKLSDNGGQLRLNIDGGTAWVLTHPENNYTGTTTVGGGAFGLGGGLPGFVALTSAASGNVATGSSVYSVASTAGLLVGQAFSGTNVPSGSTILSIDGPTTFTASVAVGATPVASGTSLAFAPAVLTLSNGAIFAHGQDRSFGGTLNLNNNTTSGFFGDYSLSFDGITNVGASANNITLSNNITAGKTLTLNNVRANSLGDNRAWAFEGAGETIINGDLTTSTSFWLRLDVNSGARLTLGINGAASNFSQGAATAIDVDRGTLKFSANNALPSSSTSGGLLLSPEGATGDVATVDLNGTTQTINGLTATSNGTVVIDNTSAAAAAFKFGANNATLNFGTGVGNYSIQNSGAGALSLVKLGNTAVVFGSSVAIGSKGELASEGGGSFTLAGQVTAASGLRAVGASTLALTGGVTNPGLMRSIEVGAGSALSLLDGSGSNFSGLTALRLGDTGTGTATLNLNVGTDTTDTLRLTAGGTLALGGTVTFNLTDAGLDENTTYTLVDLADGGIDAFGLAKMVQGAMPGGFDALTWVVDDNQVRITTGNLVTGVLYWRGLTSTAWNANLNNWSTDKSGASVAATFPGAGTDVIFAFDGASGSLITTLEQNYRLNSLAFEAGMTTPTSVSINTGTNAASRLEVSDYVSLLTGGPSAVTIGTAFKVGGAQTWTVADAAAVLTFSGPLLGGADVTKAGAGKVVLAAASDPTFNAAKTFDLTINAGAIEAQNLAALGSLANDNLANIIVNGGAFFYSNATGGTVPNPITLAGGSLSGAGNNHTYSGAVVVSAASTINMADSNGPAANSARNITLSGVLSGAGALTIDSNSTASSGNQLGGTLTLNNAASAWSGALTINRGTVTVASASSASWTGNDVTFSAFGRLILQGVNAQTLTRTGALTLAPSSVAEFQVDNVSGTLSTDFIVDQASPFSLGAGAALRIFLADSASKLMLSGGVVLGGSASISSSGDAAGVVTISGVISESAPNYGLTFHDDAGGWGQTNRLVRLTGANTFTGGLTVADGVVEFATVSNVGGAASNLGKGETITMAGGTLRFAGAVSQSTNRPLVFQTAATLSAAGTDGAVITFIGPVDVSARTADGSAFTLSGMTGSTGVLTSSVATTGDAADFTVNGGRWVLRGPASRIGDDVTVTGAGTTLELDGGLFQVRDDVTVTSSGVLNLTSPGVLSFSTATLSADASLRAVSGGRIIIGTANAVSLTDFDGLRIGTDGAGVGVLELNAAQSANEFILGNRNLDRSGSVEGSGTLTVNGNLDLYAGVISANLASAGTNTFEKISLGTVVLKGDNSGLASTGVTAVYEGTLVLDYTADNSTKLRAASQLEMRGGNLNLLGNASAATAQSVASFTLGNGGAAFISLSGGAGQDIVLNLNAITRAINAQDGTLRVVLPAGTQGAANGVTTDTLNAVGSGANAILGGWLTVDDGSGVSFARNATNAADGNIVPAATAARDSVASWVNGENVSDLAGFTGGVSLAAPNSLRFNAASGADLVLAGGGALGVGSGGILVTANVSGTPGILNGVLFSGATASGVPELIFIQDSAQPFEVSADILVNHAVTKSGSGVLLLSGQNRYSGVTEIQNGVLRVTGGNAIGDSSIVNLSDRRATTFQLLANETIGRLTGGSRQTDQDLGVVDIGPHTLTLNQTSANSTFSGYYVGTGSIVLSAVSTHNHNYNGQSSTGTFTGSVTVNGGLFQLSGASARLGGATAFTINGRGNFLLDNNDDSAPNDRIADTTPFVLNSASGSFGGETRPRGVAIRSDNNGNESETIGVLTFASGANYSSLEAAGGTNAYTAIIADSWVRQNGATLNVRGRTLGATSDSAGRSQLKVLDANDTALIAANIGGGGAVGGTAKNVSILPWAIGETLSAGLADANMGNTFVSYVDNRGLVPLSLTGEYSTFVTASTGHNVRESLLTDLGALASLTANSLILHNNNTGASSVAVSGAGAGATLGVNSGALMFTLNSGATASTAHATSLGGFVGGITAGSSGEYVIHVVNPSSAATTATLTATISSPLTSAADITKSGRGALILSGTNTAGGGARRTTINEGVLEIADLDNIGGNAGALVFAGGTLRLGAGFADDLSLRTVSFLLAGGSLDTNGVDLALSGSLGSGAGGFTKLGAGNLTLNSAATITGGATIAAGTLTVGADDALGVGGPLAISGATLDLGVRTLTVSTLTTSGASVAITGTGTLNATQGFSFGQTADLSVAAVLAGSMGLVKSQSSVLTLTGLNTYVGNTEVTAGTLVFDSIANVGAGASSLGAPTSTENGIIRMGLTTNGAGLRYVGAGHSSDRIIGLQGTTGTISVFANGTGALALTSGARFEMAGNKTLVLRGTSDAALVNSIGTLTELNGVLTLNKTDANTWVLASANAYTGATQVDNGLLRFTAEGALPAGSALRLGATTTAGVAEIIGFDQTAAGLSVQSNSASAVSRLHVASGRTLTLTGSVALGTSGGTTVLQTSGGGQLTVSNVSATGNTFIVGGNETNVTTADLTGLSSLAVSLHPASGVFLVSSTSGTNSTGYAQLSLPDAATITAGALTVGGGGSYNGNAGQVNQLRFGAGATILRVGALNIGTGSRDLGSMIFAGLAGTLDVKAVDGVSATPFNMGTGTANTAVALSTNQNTFDVTGHEVALKLSAVTIGNQNRNADLLNVFSFDTGTLEIGTLNASSKGANANTTTTNINIGGGAVTTGAWTLASTSGNGNAVATANLTGGSITFSGTILRGADAVGGGTATGTVNLAGATLDMGGFDIGSATNGITFSAQSGVLRNVGALNGTGGLTKSGAGTLTLEGAAAFTGTTTVTGGALVLAGTSLASTTATISGGTNSTLRITSVAAMGSLATLNAASGATTPVFQFALDGGGTFDLPVSFIGNSTITSTIHVSNNGSGTDGVVRLTGNGGTGYGNATLNVTGADGYSLYVANLVNSAGALGTMTFNPTTAALELGNLTVGRNTGTGTFVLGGTHAGSTVSGVISNGSGASLGGLSAVTKSGAGTWTLTGANTYTGATTVSAGTLVAATGALGGTASISVTGGALTAVDFGATPAITVGAAGTAVFSGVGLTAGAVTVDNVADDALHFSGATGTVTLTSLGGAGKSRFASNLTVGTVTGGTVTIAGATASVGTLSGGTINLGTTVLTVNDGTFAGLLAGANGSLIKATAGVLTLTGANTYGGGTSVNAGELIIQDVASLGTGAVAVAAGATLNLNNLGVSNAISVATGGIITGGPTTASVSTSGSTAVTTVLTGTGGLEKTDGGELTLTTPNFFTGGITANVAGAVISAAYLADDSSSLGASALTDPTKLVLGNGATLEFTGSTATTTSRSFTVNGAAALAVDAAAAPLTFSSASIMALDPADTTPELRLVANNSGVNRFEAQISADDIAAGRGLSALAIDGTGKWVLGGSANRFKGDVRVDVGGGATLGFESGALGSGATYASSVIEVANGSKLAWSGANTDDISSRLSVPAGATAKLDLGANTVTFAAAPTMGAGASLEKEGSGTLKISSAVSAPTLNVAVTSGTLAVNGTLGNVTLSSGAILGGSGAVVSATAVAGSTVGPGNSPGTLTAGSLAMFGGSNFEWQVQDATDHVAGYDKLAITGTLDLTGASVNNKINFKISSLLGAGDGSTLGNPLNFGPPNGNASVRVFQFATVGGVQLNSGENISDVFQFDLTQFTYSDGSASNAGLWSIEWDGNSSITLTAVPEPSTYGFGLGALALAAAAIRRRKRQAKA